MSAQLQPDSRCQKSLMQPQMGIGRISTKRNRTAHTWDTSPGGDSKEFCLQKMPCLGAWNLPWQDLLCQFGDPSTLAFKDHLQVQSWYLWAKRFLFVWVPGEPPYLPMQHDLQELDLMGKDSTSKGAIQTIMRHQLDGLVMVGNLANQAGEANHQAALFEWRNYPCAGGHRILSRGQLFFCCFFVVCFGGDLWATRWLKACAAERLPTKVIGVPVPTLGWVAGQGEEFGLSNQHEKHMTSLQSQAICIYSMHISYIYIYIHISISSIMNSCFVIAVVIWSRHGPI